MTLRAGLIGLGAMGRNHARVLSSLDGVELVGVADPAGDPHGSARGVTVHERHEDLIAVGLDICVVAAPTEFHEQIGLLLADAGVHTLIEKPLAATVDEARRLDDAFASRGLVGCVGHIERFNAALQQMRHRLEAGELGEIYQIATQRVGPFPGRIRDVGVVLDLATHDIDLTAWVADSPFTTVTAHTAHRSGRAHEDLVSATCRLESGVITNHLVNWLSPLKRRQTTVTGERGAFVADTLTADLHFFQNGELTTQWEAISRFRGVSEGNAIRYAFDKPEPLRVELEAFRDAALGEAGTEIVTMDQGRRVIEVAQAMLTSAADRSTVSVTAVPASA